MFNGINFVEIFSSFIVMAAIIDIFGSIPIFMSMKEQNKTIKAGQACLTALGLFLSICLSTILPSSYRKFQEYNNQP